MKRRSRSIIDNPSEQV